MSNRNELYDELKEVSAYVATLARVNPYQAPPAYFEESSGEVMNRISRSEEKAALPSVLSAIKSPYQAPPAYFDGLPAIIMNRILANEASSHHEELQLLSPLLRHLNKPVPFSLPKDYFNNFAGDLIDGVQAVDFVNAELEEHSPLMAAAKSNVYNVPDGYFNDLAENLFNRIRKNRRPLSILTAIKKKTMRYAAAAMITGALSIGAWTFFQSGNASRTSASSLIGIENISNEEMASYLDSTFITSNDANTTDAYDMKEEDVKELLAGVSDEELLQYLEQDGSSKDLDN